MLLLRCFLSLISVSTSRSRDGLETCFWNVSVSSRKFCRDVWSRSRLGYKVKRLGLGHKGLVYSEHYAQAQADSVTQPIEHRQSKSDPCPSKKLKFFSFMSAHNSTKSLDPVSQQTDVMKQLQTFVCSDLIDRTVFNDPSFTILPPIALQMFSAPCSSAASERVFSKAGLIMRPTRSRLSKAILAKLVFLKCNKQLL